MTGKVPSCQLENVDGVCACPRAKSNIEIPPNEIWGYQYASPFVKYNRMTFCLPVLWVVLGGGVVVHMWVFA